MTPERREHAVDARYRVVTASKEFVLRMAFEYCINWSVVARRQHERCCGAVYAGVRVT